MKSRPNGCGPQGLVGKIIPDSLFGVSVLEACNFHDRTYSKGGNAKKRRIADKKFLADMLMKVEKQSQSKVLKALRKTQAYLYFWSVRIFGSLFINQKS